jgi:hypothetical protein
VRVVIFYADAHERDLANILFRQASREDKMQSASRPVPLRTGHSARASVRLRGSHGAFGSSAQRDLCLDPDLRSKLFAEANLDRGNGEHRWPVLDAFPGAVPESCPSAERSGEGRCVPASRVKAWTPGAHPFTTGRLFDLTDRGKGAASDTP